MFWGLIMEPERRYTQQVKKSFHISMAALDIATSGDEPAQVMCSYEGRNYLLCTLKKPDVVQCNLDLEFAAGTQVSFASNGKAYVHLTGYLTDADEDGLSLADLEEQDEVEEEEQIEEKQAKKKKLKKKNEQLEPPSKKAKLLNGLVKEEQGDEEESDDPDFEEEEEAEGEDESDDEEASDEEEDGEEEEGDSEDEDEDNEEEQEEVPEKLTKKQKKQLKQEQQQINGEQKKSKKEQQQPKKQKKILEKGVIVEDLVEGNGPPAKPGRFINVYYEGRLEKTNKVFDATKKGPGFKFRLGSGEVIKAWDIGVAGMKVGGKRKITCPPHTAYGPKGSPPAIPPNSTLVFIVELKKVN